MLSVLLKKDNASSKLEKMGIQEILTSNIVDSTSLKEYFATDKGYLI
tara:strand:- start:8292 stop:8432 length:141 start_codon:yes stop_codon:yes gene_type:complete